MSAAWEFLFCPIHGILTPLLPQLGYLSVRVWMVVRKWV